MRAKGRTSLIAGLAGAVLLLSLGAPLAGSSAQTQIPRLDYAGITKSKHAPRPRRFVLKLFTAYAKPAGSTVSAFSGKGGAVARYGGRNNGFDEWSITGRAREGRRLIRVLRREIRKRGRTRFRASLASDGAPQPTWYTCVVRDYGKLGSCEGDISIQR